MMKMMKKKMLSMLRLVQELKNRMLKEMMMIIGYMKA